MVQNITYLEALRQLFLTQDTFRHIILNSPGTATAQDKSRHKLEAIKILTFTTESTQSVTKALPKALPKAL